MSTLMTIMPAYRSMPDWLFYFIAIPFTFFILYTIAGDIWLQIGAWQEQRRGESEKK